MSKKPSKIAASFSLQPEGQEEHEETPEEGAQQAAEAPEAEEFDTIEALEMLTGGWMAILSAQEKMIEAAKKRQHEGEGSAGIPESSIDMALRTLSGTQASVAQLASMVQLVDEYQRKYADVEDETEQQKKKRELEEKRLAQMIESSKYMSLKADREVEEKMHESKQQQHLFFADRVFGCLLDFYGIKCPRYELVELKDIYKKSMGRAVLGISMLYRDQWREVFSGIQKRMFNYENFLAYCCMVPVQKHGPYFYSILQRLAIIFEMALFCFENKVDYFEIAINCVSHFFDADFFYDSGDWPRLQEAADIVHNLTLPLQNALGCEKGKAESFSDVINHLIEFNVFGSTSRQCSLLLELNKKFETRSGKAQEAQTSVSTRSGKAREAQTGVSGAEVGEKEILVKYFRECNIDDCPETFYQLAKGEDYVLDLESWIYDAPKQKKREEVADMEKVMKELKITGEKDEPTHSRKQSQKKGKGTSGLAEASSVQTEVPGRETGAIPKKRTRKKSKGPSYVTIQTDHVEELLELYKNVLPSFLKTYLHEYFIPKLEDKSVTFSSDKDCFVLPESLLKERERREQEKTCRQKRLWGISPYGFRGSLPIGVERKLDTYIGNKQYRATPTGTGGEILYLAGPRNMTADKAKELNILWIIKSNLDEVLDKETERNKAAKKFKKLLRNTKDIRSSTAEKDHETIRQLRMVCEVAEEMAASTQIRIPKPTTPEEPKRRKKLSHAQRMHLAKKRSKK